MSIKSCVNHYFSLSFLRKENIKEIRRHVSSLSTIQSITIKLNFYYRNMKNAVETAKIAVESCYVQQFLTPLSSIDFWEIRGLLRVQSLVGTELG